MRPSDGKLLGDDNTYTLTGKVAWTPAADLKFKLSFDYTHANENGGAYQNVEIDEDATFPAVVSVHAGCPGATFPPPHVPDIDDPRCAKIPKIPGIQYLIVPPDLQDRPGIPETR